MKNSKETVYETVINGIVYRGSLEYIKQVIAEERENHD